MGTTLWVGIAGIVLIALLGFLGNRRRSVELADWTVGGRSFGALTMWFLQAGEIFTTFTFLGMAGLAFEGGVSAMYALPYVPLAFVGLYFLAPRLWRIAREQGYLTQADFLGDRFASPLLGTTVAVLGVIFLLPYLQLQITGLGLAVRIATGDDQSGLISMVVASVLTAAFVLWSGIRGVATASYFKDAIMVLVLLLIVIAVPLQLTGGIGAGFQRLLTERPEVFTVHSGSYDHVWFLTSMLVSMIGTMFMTLPHTWPALLSANGPKALRRNYIFLPIYEIALVLPILIGMLGILVLPGETESNAVLLRMTALAFPDWLLGIVLVATAATAMVPAAAITMAMSTLVARNVVRTNSASKQMRINQITVVGAVALALLLGILRPDLLANLLLLTFSGLAQMAPAFILGMLRRRVLGASPVLAGIITGELLVILLTFAPIDVGNVNVGLIGLAANVLVLVVVGLPVSLRRSPVPSHDHLSVPASSRE